MPRRSVYSVHYRLTGQNENQIDVIAMNKWEAYMTAVYEAIPKRDGELPYSAWVSSVTYQNGNCKRFNTFEGKPI